MPAARVRAEEAMVLRDTLTKHLEEARQNQAKYYNEKHLPISYRVGDKVMLNAKNIKTTRPSKKLNYKYIGPFEVELPIEKQAYRLKLPKSYQIHNVFHVSLLEPYRGRLVLRPTPLPELINEEEHYEIEKILNSRRHKKKLQYFVK